MYGMHWIHFGKRLVQKDLNLLSRLHFGPLGRLPFDFADI